MADAFTWSKLCMQFSYACVCNFKVGSERLLQGISCISYRTGVWINAKVCLHVYHILKLLMKQLLCLLCRGRVSVQQFRDGVMLRMCRGLTIIVICCSDVMYFACTCIIMHEFLWLWNYGTFILNCILPSKDSWALEIHGPKKRGWEFTQRGHLYTACEV